MADTFDFPPDLVQTARLLAEKTAELEALERPQFVADYPEEVEQKEAKLREECRRLTEEVVMHPFWDTLEGPARVEARMALKRTAKSR